MSEKLFLSDGEPTEGLLGALLRDRDLQRQFQAVASDANAKTIELSSIQTAPLMDRDPPEPADHKATVVRSEPAEAPKIHGNRFANIPMRRVGKLIDPKSASVDYRIVGKLGAGGTGVVYQAHQRAVDREVAIKMLREDLSSDAISRERFLTEARVIGGLDHPNVIALHEVYADESGGLYYSMKRIDGASWDKQIADLSQPQNVDILLRVADAIRYAHSRGLVHRDIKPENVMLGKFGEVLLADWGLAVNRNQATWSDDTRHSIGGTPAYMAPELARGLSKDITYQTDVYLLGAILFQILTGDPPHQGSTVLDCIRAAAANEIRPTELEGESMDIARKAMATDPGDRYASVEEFIAAIDQLRQHDQSGRLVRRAKRRIESDGEATRYETFAVADALLAEAIDLWPDNQSALELRKRWQLELARTATARGDLELAISLFEAAGHAESDEAKAAHANRSQRDTSQEQVSRYSTLFTHSPDAGLLVQVSTGMIVEANEMFRRMFGYDEDQVLGKPITDLNLWACPQRRLELVDVLQRDGYIDSFEAEFVHQDGHRIDVLISGRIVELQGERMLVSSIRDISQRKRTENELLRSQRRMRDLQRLAGLAAWSYDVRTGEVTWSDEVFKLAGRPIDQGMPTREEYLEMIHPEDRPKLQTALETSLESGTAYEILVRQRGPRGRYRHVLVRGQPIFDAEGNTVEVYGVLMPQRT